MNARNKILLVDDERHINELAIRSLTRLRQSGNFPIAEKVDLYLPDVCSFQMQGETCIESTILDNNYDLVLLDVNLCAILGSHYKKSGLRILRNVRRAGYRGRILLYSGYDLRSDKSMNLPDKEGFTGDLASDLADDFLLKTVSFRDLLERINKLLSQEPRFFKFSVEKMKELAEGYSEPEG